MKKNAKLSLSNVMVSSDRSSCGFDAPLMVHNMAYVGAILRKSKFDSNTNANVVFHKYELAFEGNTC